MCARILLITIALPALLASESVFAFCSQPSFYSNEPSPPGTYARPSAPFCLSDYRFSGRHSCEIWEIDSYIDDINDYIDDLNDYVIEANELANEAIRFAEEAADYAACEADEAKSELR